MPFLHMLFKRVFSMDPKPQEHYSKVKKLALSRFKMQHAPCLLKALPLGMDLAPFYISSVYFFVYKLHFILFNL